MATRPNERRLRGALSRWGRPISNRWLDETRSAMSRSAQYGDGFRRLRDADGSAGSGIGDRRGERMEPARPVTALALLLERSRLE